MASATLESVISHSPSNEMVTRSAANTSGPSASRAASKIFILFRVNRPGHFGSSDVSTKIFRLHTKVAGPALSCGP